jgi:hypothetical protein
MKTMMNCPTCRAAFNGSPEEHFQRVWVLVNEREPGRSTPVAQNTLAVYYDNGLGVAQNYAEAARLFQAAAEHGYAIAQYNLAICYRHGQGVLKDDGEAFRWSRAAAEQGMAKAQTFVASCYEEATGVVRDAEKAAKWYRRAAEQGVVKAQLQLGLLLVQPRSGESKVQRTANLYEMAKWIRMYMDYEGAENTQETAARTHIAPLLTDVLLSLTQLLGLVPGVAVELHGLRTTAINGRRGVVIRKKAKRAGYVGVLLDGEKMPSAVRAENMCKVEQL